MTSSVDGLGTSRRAPPARALITDRAAASDAGRIPFRFGIGVTGHREILDPPAVAAQVAEALRRVQRLIGPSAHTPLEFTVVSALAEGADRLVAREVLQHDGAELEAALPLPRGEYRRDFGADPSKREFDELVTRAREVTEIRRTVTRQEAYEQVGRYVVDRSDLLIAVWDGEAARGQGGTADVVAYARAHAKPLILIDPDGHGQVLENADVGLGGSLFDELDRYNRIGVPDVTLRDETARRSLVPVDVAEQWCAEVPVEALASWLWPFYLRADLLARRNQRWYEALGTALFLMAAAAAVVGGAGVLLPTGTWQLAWIEVALMLGLLLVIGAGRSLRLHERWISYRFLAERFRSAFFLAAAGLSGRREGGPKRVSRGRDGDEWLRRAFAEVWGRRPKVKVSASNVPGLRRFLAEAWIEDQARYHRKTSRKNVQRQRTITVGIALVFGVTLVVALLQGVDVGQRTGYALLAAGALGFLASTLPAVGGALGGIRADREYERHAERFGRMADQLDDIRRRMEAAPDLRTVRAVATEVEELMLEENRDWFVVVRFHDFELSG